MPETKEFFTWKDYSVRSDSRDILVSGEHDFDVTVWCNRMKVNANIHIKLPGGPSIWRIKDDEERTLFFLRWGSL